MPYSTSYNGIPIQRLIVKTHNIPPTILFDSFEYGQNESVMIVTEPLGVLIFVYTLHQDGPKIKKMEEIRFLPIPDIPYSITAEGLP